MAARFCRIRVRYVACGSAEVRPSIGSSTALEMPRSFASERARSGLARVSKKTVVTPRSRIRFSRSCSRCRDGSASGSRPAIGTTSTPYRRAEILERVVADHERVDPARRERLLVRQVETVQVADQPGSLRSVVRRVRGVGARHRRGEGPRRLRHQGRVLPEVRVLVVAGVLDPRARHRPRERDHRRHVEGVVGGVVVHRLVDRRCHAVLVEPDSGQVDLRDLADRELVLVRLDARGSQVEDVVVAARHAIGDEVERVEAGDDGVVTRAWPLAGGGESGQQPQHRHHDRPALHENDSH